MKLKEGPEDGGGWGRQSSGSPKLSTPSFPQPGSLSGCLGKGTLQRWLNERSGDGKMSAERAGRLTVITRLLRRAREGAVMEEKRRCYAGGFEGGGGGGWKSRRAGGLWELERQGNRFSLKPPGGKQPCCCRDFNAVTPTLDVSSLKL